MVFDSMQELENNVRLAWQLVAQFVSWDFCRYACQQSEKDVPEPDVLTFLRNMFIERTEKSISEVTKHEIIAKFILEIKAIKTVSRLTCITALSETVQRICPELIPAVNNLLHHLESLLNILDSSQECQNTELVEMRIEDAVSDFTKEANKNLPPPDLLKLLDPWVHKHSHHKEKKKSSFRPFLFEKVIHCLRQESITAMEAKLIAVALCDDNILKQTVLHGESETETEAESESISVSFQSSLLLSQEGSQPVGLKQQRFSKSDMDRNKKTADVIHDANPSNLFSVQSHVPAIHQTDLHFDDSLHFTLDSQEYAEPPVLLPMTKLPLSLQQKDIINVEMQSDSAHDPPQNCELNIIEEQVSSKVCNLQVSDDYQQFAQSSCSDSDDDEPILQRRTKLIRQKSTCEIRTVCDSDTSDCDKDNEFRFLTPTLFKEGYQGHHEKPKTLWLSDSESNDSSVITTVIDSQKDDPVWNEGTSVFQQSAKRKRTLRSSPQKKTSVTSTKRLHRTPTNLQNVLPNSLHKSPPKKTHKSPAKKLHKSPPKKLHKSPSKNLHKSPSKKNQKKKLFTGIQNYLVQRDVSSPLATRNCSEEENCSIIFKD